MGQNLDGIIEWYDDRFDSKVRITLVRVKFNNKIIKNLWNKKFIMNDLNLRT